MVTEEQFEIAHGCKSNELFIVIPHQTPPKLISAKESPPNRLAGDINVEGDHDLHSCIPVIDGLNYKGHQRIKVQILAEQAITDAA